MFSLADALTVVRPPVAVIVSKGLTRRRGHGVSCERCPVLSSTRVRCPRIFARHDSFSHAFAQCGMEGNSRRPVRQALRATCHAGNWGCD